MSGSNSFSKVVRVLPHGMSAHDFADACRFAARELLEGRGWGKRELAAWLLVRYAPLTLSAPRHVNDAPMTRKVTDDDVAHVLAASRQAVRKELLGHFTPDWVDQTVERNWVARATDEWGETAFMPISLPSMRLGSRVLSLLAADYLTRHENERVARTSETRMLVEPARNVEVQGR